MKLSTKIYIEILAYILRCCVPSPKILLLKFSHLLIEDRNRQLSNRSFQASHRWLTDVSFLLVSSKLRKRRQRQLLAAICCYQYWCENFVLKDYLDYIRLRDKHPKWEWFIDNFRGDIRPINFAMVKTELLSHCPLLLTTAVQIKFTYVC
jgi:hypothetical protein